MNGNFLDENMYFDAGDMQNNTYEKPNHSVFNVDNYLNTRLGPGETSRRIKIRILLTEDIDGRKKIAIPVNIHSLKLTEGQNKNNIVASTGYKQFICLDDKHIHNETDLKCPLCAKKDEIFQIANAAKDESERKALCYEAYKYKTKTAYVVRCIERGKEQDGVKFWRFNKHDDGSGIFDMLQELFIQYRFPIDENGNEAFIVNAKGEKERNPNYILPQDSEDIFDYVNGRDIIITITQSQKGNKVALKVMVDTRQSPLATSEEQYQQFLNDSKDWRDMYRTKSYDYLELIADDKTPIFDKSKGKFVAWVDKSKEKEELHKEAEQEFYQYQENDVDDIFGNDLPV